MKYYFSNENLSNLTSTLAIVASDKDAKIVINFGERSNAKEMCHVATCLGGTEQENVKFLGEIPEGFEKPEKFAFDARLFITVLQSCLTLKERTYIETAQSICYVGVDGAARFPLQIIAPESVPDGIPMDPAKTLVQFAVKAADFMSALRAGAYAAAGGVDQFSNPVLMLDTGAKPQLYVYSTDGKTIARGRCDCMVPDGNEDRETRLKAYLKEKNLNAFMIALPKKVVADIQKFGSQAEQLNMVITDRHIFLSPNVSTIYAASLGAQFTHVETYVEQWMQMDKSAEVVVDLAVFKASLDLLLKYMEVSGAEKTPILMTCAENEICLDQIEGGEGATRLKVVETSSNEKMTVCFNGKKVMETINSLNKGNLKISFLAGDTVPVMFSNGALEQEANGSVSFILPVKRKTVETAPAKEEKEETVAEETDSADNGESAQ